MFNLLGILWNNPIVKTVSSVVAGLSALLLGIVLIRRDARKDERAKNEKRSLEKLIEIAAGQNEQIHEAADVRDTPVPDSLPEWYHDIDDIDGVAEKGRD